MDNTMTQYIVGSYVEVLEDDKFSTPAKGTVLDVGFDWVSVQLDNAPSPRVKVLKSKIKPITNTKFNIGDKVRTLSAAPYTNSKTANCVGTVDFYSNHSGTIVYVTVNRNGVMDRFYYYEHQLELLNKTLVLDDIFYSIEPHKLPVNIETTKATDNNIHDTISTTHRYNEYLIEFKFDGLSWRELKFSGNAGMSVYGVNNDAKALNKFNVARESFEKLIGIGVNIKIRCHTRECKTVTKTIACSDPSHVKEEHKTIRETWKVIN